MVLADGEPGSVDEADKGCIASKSASAGGDSVLVMSPALVAGVNGFDQVRLAIEGGRIRGRFLADQNGQPQPPNRVLKVLRTDPEAFSFAGVLLVHAERRQVDQSRR